jgi:hypothetical protein
MEDAVVLERISSLKGRLGYEEKKAKKLGFPSIYEYIEDKIKNENKSLSPESKVLNKIAKPIKKNKKAKISTCSCC